MNSRMLASVVLSAAALSVPVGGAFASVITNTTDFPTPGGVYQTLPDQVPITFGSLPITLYSLSLSPPTTSMALPTSTNGIVFEDLWPNNGDIAFTDTQSGDLSLQTADPLFDKDDQISITNTTGTAAGPFSIAIDSLSMSGGGLPAGVILQASPTLASTGTESITDLGSGQFQIDSSFDLYTELSLDGGSTWTPASAPLEVSLASVPEPASTTLLLSAILALFGRRKRHRHAGKN